MAAQNNWTAAVTHCPTALNLCLTAVAHCDAAIKNWTAAANNWTAGNNPSHLGAAPQTGEVVNPDEIQALGEGRPAMNDALFTH